jgi:hypothetical protein
MPPSGTTYLVDTCVWVNIRDEHKDSEAIWSQLLLCVEVKMVKTVRQVYDELERRFANVHARLKPYRDQLLVPDADMYTAAVKAEIVAINADHPKLYNPLGGGNPADPWLIGVAKVGGYTVVTDEATAGKGYQSKIPHICGKRGAGCINRLALFEALGINP